MNGYSKKKHIAEAEQYRDRIGNRLLHPEKVDPDKKHLIQDDIKRCEQVLSIPCSGNVLDVGCSDGTLTIEIAKKWPCDMIMGIDVSSSAIEEAKNNLLKQPEPIREKTSFVQGFIEDISISDSYFDTIYACETLEHVGENQLEKTMNTLVRILAQDGNMIVTVPNRYPAQKYVEEKRDRWDWPTHYRHFTKDSLESLLSTHFQSIDFYPLYDEEVQESIYLICNCQKKK